MLLGFAKRYGIEDFDVKVFRNDSESSEARPKKETNIVLLIRDTGRLQRKSIALLVI